MALSDTETLNFVTGVTLAAAITHKETHTSADIIKFDARLAWFSFGSYDRIVLENYTPTLPQPLYPFATCRLYKNYTGDNGEKSTYVSLKCSRMRR